LVVAQAFQAAIKTATARVALVAASAALASKLCVPQASSLLQRKCPSPGRVITQLSSQFLTVNPLRVSPPSLRSARRKIKRGRAKRDARRKERTRRKRRRNAALKLN